MFPFKIILLVNRLFWFKKIFKIGLQNLLYKISGNDTKNIFSISEDSIKNVYSTKK